MATLETVYKGNLRTEITHVQSGNKVTTDAPVDNNGKGEFISPTDMVAAALGSCMLTIMGMSAARASVDIDGTRVETTKVMAAEPRRIGEIIIDLYFPRNYDEKTRLILKRAADTCPVSKSLREDLVQTVRFHFPEK